MLTCDAGDFGYYDCDWYWQGHSELKYRYPSKRKRCCSCKKQIQWGEESIEFYRYRHFDEWGPGADIEYRIYGDEVPLGSYYTCETCSGLILRLEELGYLYTIGGESIQCQIREYLDESGLPTL